MSSLVDLTTLRPAPWQHESPSCEEWGRSSASTVPFVLWWPNMLQTIAALSKVVGGFFWLPWSQENAPHLRRIGARERARLAESPSTSAKRATSPDASVDTTASSEPKWAVILLAMRSLTPGILVKTIRPMVCQGLKRMTPLHPFQSRILARWTTAKRETMYSLKAMELLMFGFGKVLGRMECTLLRPDLGRD